jgi:hypothetical protein
MTKFQARDIAIAQKYIALGMIDTAARSVSALIRSAMRSKDAAEIRAFAEAHGLTKHPEFIA